ncbi:MAG: hypothetical protein AB2689_10225 [Candidatus Thiodiazotropha taylori]
MIVDTLQYGEPCSFPYLGNVPTIRWRSGATGVDARRRIDRAALDTQYEITLLYPDPSLGR